MQLALPHAMTTTGATPSPPPPGARRAVIDVGTNSVKLLVAAVSGGEVHPLHEQSKQTRLGRGFYPAHRLQPEAVRQTAEAVAHFARSAATWKPDRIRVIGTSAARDAENPGDLIDAVRQVAGLDLEVLSGEAETDLVFRGVLTDRTLQGMPLLITDVGGGSTEFILGDRGQAVFQHSHPLGTVRLLEQLHPANPPTDAECAHCLDLLREFLKRKLKPALDPLLAAFAVPPHLVGTGGTTTILARIILQMMGFDRESIERVALDRGQVRALRERLWRLPLEERRQIVGLPPNRADVILTGVAIYETIMECLNLNTLRISTRGLRFAAVL